MAKKYEITTIQELCAAAIASNNVDGIVADLTEFLKIAIDLKNLPSSLISFDDTKFNWIDDGDTGVSGINIQITKSKKDPEDKV